ncbi:MAG TPA: PocR ligand-binding domain-containing protein [Gammaproteobacteria bacterium]|nr:PocR ligand-binding domain-containing protein [Gammaproteobacteria bacterium]
MLTAKDMQNLLQVDRSTIYRMAEAGRIPAIKIGKQWRFPGDQVEDWLGTQIGLPQVTSQRPVSNTSGNLADLLPLACVQLILDTFADSLGVMLVVTDMDGNPVTAVSHPCGLFAAINKVPNAVQKCVESWHNLGQAIELEPKFKLSHLGLLCARAFIRVGAELKGMVVVGGIAPQQWPPAPEPVQQIAAEFGLKPELIIPHLDEVFYLNEAERAEVLPFVQRIANIIAHIVTERNSFMNKLNAIQQLAMNN